MAAPIRVRLPESARFATIASAAMIAQQVAGKAARDALYLSSFDVKTLPVMMAASAVVSLVAVLWLSRMMVRYSPGRVVPVAFAVSGAAFLAEWALSFRAPGLAAIALYLHTALFGAAIISAFWSLINETFPPHTGRSAISWIAAGGTLGGVLGGLAAWSASRVIAVPTILPLLASVNVICLWGVTRLRDADGAAEQRPSSEPEPPFEPLRVLRGSPYLRNLSLVVALGAATSSLLDYVFSAAAVRSYTNGPQLLAFFAVFWLVIGVLSFAWQLLLGRIALEKLGLAVTVGLLPAFVVLTGAMALVLPGLYSMAIVRGGEATQRNSLFRVAYELLYTPLAEQAKRSIKMLIDVGFDRLGVVAASAIAMATLHYAPAGRVDVILLVVAIGCSLAGLARSRALHRGYVALLEENLGKAAEKLEVGSAAPHALSQEKIDVRDQVVEHLDALHSEAERLESLAAFVEPVKDLASDDPARVRRMLGAEDPLPAPLVGFAMLLLADKELHPDAIRALRKCARKATGQLIDALCDASQSFDIRRRIPRVLSECPTQPAVDGLFRGLDDDRFEVRYACGRALLAMTANPALNIARDQVIAAVSQEVKRAKSDWTSQVLDDDDDEQETTGLFDRLRVDRIDRSKEHVFNLLALTLDPESLRTAFNALHTEDEQLRGTALEYLETVLPDEVRELLWPFLGKERPIPAARPAKEILADIVQVSGSPVLVCHGTAGSGRAGQNGFKKDRTRG